MDQVVHLVIGNTDHEGSDTIRAFEDKSIAEEFAKECTTYEKTRPDFPDDDDEKAVERWERKQCKWRKNHPAGDYSHAWYGVVDVPFVKAIQ